MKTATLTERSSRQVGLVVSVSSICVTLTYGFNSYSFCLHKLTLVLAVTGKVYLDVVRTRQCVVHDGTRDSRVTEDGEPPTSCHRDDVAARTSCSAERRVVAHAHLALERRR